MSYKKAQFLLVINALPSVSQKCIFLQCSEEVEETKLKFLLPNDKSDIKLENLTHGAKPSKDYSLIINFSRNIND